MTRSPAAIELVIFDLGRVLIRICDSWPQACELAQVRPTARLADPAVARQILTLNNEFESGRLTGETYFKQAGDLAGLSQDEVRKIVTAWLRGPFPDVIDLVQSLLESGTVQVACLSNTNALHWQLMHDDPRHRLPLRDLHHAFASHLIGSMKPDDVIYQHVEDTTGVAPAQILFFDDNEANIAKAHERGWQGELIDITQSPAEQIQNSLRQHGVI